MASNNLEQTYLKQIKDICKATELSLKAEYEGKDIHNPINSDICKAQKAMAYEDIVTLVKKYIKEKRETK